MCGIIGYASRLGIDESDWLVEARDKMSYRGPDNGGLWVSDDNKVSFGHRRLSIIATNEDSNQPLTYTFNGNTYVITFNGEIYNFEYLRGTLESLGYIFSTDSDTEVLVVCYIHWKELCLNKLEGMFAFAIYDVAGDRIFFARDRIGEKPFYYFRTNRTFYFSSEFLPLLSHVSLGKSIDRSAIYEYFNLGFLSEERSFNKSVKKLLPGHFGWYNLEKNTLQISRYFEIVGSNVAVGDSYDSAILEFDSLFHGAVTKQLRSDVPVGVLLSGGIDSSLVSCVGSMINRDVINYTVDFGDNEEELLNSKTISNFYGAEHRVLKFTDLSISMFDNIISKIDEPLSDSSFIPTYLISKFINENGGKVVLGGDGADELFGGYSYYVNIPKVVSKLTMLPNWGIKALLNAFNSPYLMANWKFKKWIYNLDKLATGTLPNMREVFTSRELHELTFGGAAREDTDHFEKHYKEIESVLYNLTYFDLKMYLGSNILMKNDRASMLASIETRAPFLDESILGFAFGSLEDIYKTRGNKPKSFLIDYSRKIFPPDYIYNRKRGFTFTDRFVSNPIWSSYFKEIIRRSEFDFLNKNYLYFIINNLGKGDSDKFVKIFNVVVLLRWIENNKLIID